MLKVYGTNQVLFTGPARDVNLGSSYDYPREFLPVDLVNGWRNVIDALIVDITPTYSTELDAAAQGEDFVKHIARILIEDSAGKLMNLTGEEARINAFSAFGRHNLDDIADSDGTPQVTYRLLIPFSEPRLVRPKDSALPADIFRREDFVLRFQAANSAADLDSGTVGSGVLDKITIRCVAVCHGERSFEGKIRRVVESQQTEANDRFPVTSIAGRKMLGLTLHKGGVSGGASLANITKIDSQVLGFRNLNDEDLEDSYRMAMGRFDYSRNPYDHAGADAANAKAFPLLYTTPGSKISQLRVVPETPEVEVTESSEIASKRILKEYLTPLSSEDLEYAAARRGIDLGQAKSAGENKPVSADSMLAQVLPVKVSGRTGRFRG